MRRFRIITSLLAILIANVALRAENGMNSPYTRYGLGQLSSMETGTSKGMGGTGIGLRNSNQINLLNPASYSSVDTLTFLMDIGLSLHNANFSEGNMKMNARNTTFDYFAIQYRLMPKLGMSLGLMPISNIGYNYSNSTIINKGDGTNNGEDQINSTNVYYGNGGLRQIVMGLGWEPIQGLSVGANFSYIYGEIYHYIHNQYNDPAINTMTKQYSTDITTYKIDLGVQYQFVSGKSRYTLGATYALGHPIDDVAYIQTMMTSSTSTTANIKKDTVPSFSIPTELGAGISYNYDNRLTIAADYSMQQYSRVKFFDMPGADRHRASLGVEYTPNSLHRNLFKRAHYRAGLHYSTSHFMIQHDAGYTKGPHEYGISVGIGLPIMNRYNNKTIINISGQAVRVEPQVPGMITENYLRLNIGLSFNERWFDKWRIE